MAKVEFKETKRIVWNWDDICQGDIVVLNGTRLCIATLLPDGDGDDLVLVELADGDTWRRDVDHVTITEVIAKNAVTIMVSKG